MRAVWIFALCALLLFPVSSADSEELDGGEFGKRKCQAVWVPNDGSGEKFVGFLGMCDKSREALRDAKSSLPFNLTMFRDQSALYKEKLGIVYSFGSCTLLATTAYVNDTKTHEGKPAINIRFSGNGKTFILPVTLSFDATGLEIFDDSNNALESQPCNAFDVGGAINYSHDTTICGGFPVDLYHFTSNCYHCGFAVNNEHLELHGTVYNHSSNCFAPDESTETIKCPVKCFTDIKEVKDADRLIGTTIIRGCEPSWYTRLTEPRDNYTPCKERRDRCNGKIHGTPAEFIQCYDCAYSNLKGADLNGYNSSDSCVTGIGTNKTTCNTRCFQYTTKNATQDGGSIFRGCTENFDPSNPKPGEWLNYSVCGNKTHSKPLCNDDFGLKVSPFQCYSCAYTNAHDGNLTMYGEGYANDKTCLDDKLADKTMCSTRCFYHSKLFVGDNGVLHGGVIIRGCQPSLRDSLPNPEDNSHPLCTTTLCNKLPDGFSMPDNTLPKDASERIGYICTPDAIKAKENEAEKCWKEVKAKQTVIFVILGASGLELLFIVLTITAFVLAICHKKRKRRRRHGKKSGSKSKSSKKSKDSKSKDSKSKPVKEKKDVKKAKSAKGPTTLPV